MAKPIIDIAVNDDAFRRFIELYNAYSAKLDKQPQAWSAISEAMGSAGTALKQGADESQQSLALATGHAGALVEHFEAAAKSQNALRIVLSGNERGFASLAKTGAKAAESIGKAFTGAVSGSIGEIGAGLTGVVSKLGPVGLAAGAIAAAVGTAVAAQKALADVAVTRQRSAFGLGVTPGEQSSFTINAQQFMEPGAFAAAANAQLSYDSSASLATLGIDFNAARKMKASDLAFLMLRNATKAAQATPDTPLENIPAIMQYLNLGGQVGDVRNALALGLPALDAAQRATNTNAGRFDISRKAVSASAALKKAFESTGVAFQSGAINRMTGADHAIATIAGALGGDRAAAAAVAHAFHNVARSVPPAMHVLQTEAHHAAAALRSVWQAVNMPIAGTAEAATGIAMGRGNAEGAPRAQRISSDMKRRAAQIIVDVAKRKGVDPRLALADALQESNLNSYYAYQDYYAGHIPAGTSVGLFSLMDNGGEGSNMTIAERRDPRTNANVALSEFAAVMHASRAEIRRREHGLGIHDWTTDPSRLSPGQIAALAERPAGAENYAQIVDAFYQAILKAERVSRRRPSPKPHVSVKNSTSARVSVSANAASW